MNKDCVFFNDTTSQLNWGCHSTTFFTKQKLKKLNFNIRFNMTLHESLDINNINNLVNNIKKNSIKYIFINGEGSLYEQYNIKGKNMIKFILMLKDIKCNIYLVNSAFDLQSISNINIFKQCITSNLNIYLREPISINNFNKYYNNCNVIFQPDFLYLISNEKNKYTNTDFLNNNKLKKKEYIVIGGNSNYYRNDRKPYDAINTYINMINLIKRNTNKKLILYASSQEEVDWLQKIANKTNIKYFNVNNTDWKCAFTLLSNAYLSISGRYHPTIMSLIGSIPSLMFSANHCKMNGVNEMFTQNLKVINSHDIHNNYEYIINFIKMSEVDYIDISNNISKNIIKYYNLIKDLSYD